MKYPAYLLFALLLIGTLTIRIEANPFSDEELVTFYPTYGYQEGDHWVIPMRVWVHEHRDLVETWVTHIAESIGQLDPQEIDRFRSRITDFVADSESDEVVRLAFDDDQEYSVQDAQGNITQTDENGLIIGVVKISRDKAGELVKQQNSHDGWLTFHATSREHSGSGRVRLLEPEGLSVISDIDDTIKITDIPKGPEVVVKNTFFREYEPAPNMAGLYRQWTGASFHYVSGGPWQLYPALSDFLFGAQGGFPEGTFHMKNVRKNILNADTWNDLTELVTNENITVDQKITQISEIMQRFPNRKVILVGDSGEKDPEVYRTIRNKFPAQIQEIKIRDVVNDREKNPGRLADMTIIPISSR